MEMHDVSGARAAWEKKDLLGATRDKKSRLHGTLYGVRRELKRRFKITEMPFVHSNDAKVFQRQRMVPSFPWAYVSVNTVGLNEQSINPNTAARHSVGHSFARGDQGNATISKHYMFPIIIGMEMHFITDDYMTAMAFIDTALIIATSNKMNFKMKMLGVENYVRITPESREFTLPRSDKENEQDPEGFDIVFNFRVETWTGVTKEVAKINNMGEVELGAIVVDHEGNVLEEETTIIQTADMSNDQ